MGEGAMKVGGWVEGARMRIAGAAVGEGKGGGAGAGGAEVILKGGAGEARAREAVMDGGGGARVVGGDGLSISTGTWYDLVWCNNTRLNQQKKNEPKERKREEGQK